MAQPAYSYGTQATVHGSKPTDSYYVLDSNNDPSGGAVITGNLGVTGNLDVSGDVTFSGEGGGVSAVTINSQPGTRALTATGNAVFTRLIDASGQDGLIQVKNFAGAGIGIRADATTGDATLEAVPPSPGAVIPAIIVNQLGQVNTLGTTTVTRAAAGVDALLKVMNFAGEGIGIRADDAQVVGGGTIERVTGGAAANVPDITLESTGAVTFAHDITVQGAMASAPLFNLSGAGGSNYGLINCPGGGAGTPVANTTVTGNTIIHLTPVIGTILTNPISYTLSTGVGFTIFNFNAGAVDVVFSITALSAST